MRFIGIIIAAIFAAGAASATTYNVSLTGDIYRVDPVGAGDFLTPPGVAIGDSYSVNYTVELDNTPDVDIAVARYWFGAITAATASVGGLTWSGVPSSANANYYTAINDNVTSTPGQVYDAIGFSTDAAGPDQGGLPIFRLGSILADFSGTVVNDTGALPDDLPGLGLSVFDPAQTYTQFVFADGGSNFGSFRGSIDSVAVNVAPVPLPATGLLLIAGLGLMAAVRRRH